MRNNSVIAAQSPEALAERVARLNRLAAEPGAEHYLNLEEVDIEAWNLVGDPLCEALFQVLRERKLLAGDIYENARKLQAEGEAAAIAFFADVEAVPAWADFEAMRVGASMACRNPVGMLFGMHGGLPFTYIDPATALVMGGTGRLSRSGDFRRRYWETATGFVGALDVDGMKPGGASWEKWVRIRFLHTMIRMGILRSGRWSLPTAMPIGQVASAATAHIFGPFRVNIIRYFGGAVSREEEDSFALMWRWVARIEGANNQLLGRTHAEQFRLQSRMHQFLYEKSPAAIEMTASVVEGSATMKAFLLPQRMHAAIVRRLLSEEMMQTLPGRDVPGDLGLPVDRPAGIALAALSVALKAVNQVTRIPVVKRLAERHGQRLINHVVERGLDGMKAEYRGTPVAGRPTDQ